jgi:hypothetical protein
MSAAIAKRFGIPSRKIRRLLRAKWWPGKSPAIPRGK